MQRGDEAEHDRAGEGQARRECHDRGIEADLRREPDLLREHRGQALHHPCGQQESGRPAHRREQQALGEELLHQSSGPGAESRADGHLPRASDRAGQQEVRHVGAAHEQEEHHRADQDEERGPHVAHEVGLQREHGRAPARVEVRVLADEVRGQALHLDAGLGDRGLGLEPSDHGQPPPACIAHGIVEERNPERRAAGELERLRHHADHGGRSSIQGDRPPHDGGSPPKRRRHRPSEMTATFGAPVGSPPP